MEATKSTNASESTVAKGDESNDNGKTRSKVPENTESGDTSMLLLPRTRGSMEWSNKT